MEREFEEVKAIADIECFDLRCEECAFFSKSCDRCLLEIIKEM